MAQKKKLQVFVSSTYTDLREERQAAVEAILSAGHIPAGMELFAAGDESQMNVIKRWIDESDVYLLILGGRYGSLEPKSGKSYIHLEYEYAAEKEKPLFAVVIEEEFAKERVKTHPLGVGVIETENAAQLKEFRSQVVSKMVRFWRDSKDIKIAIMETMGDFSRREDLRGWVLGNEAVDTGAVAEEIARLGKENASLREQLSGTAQAPVRYNGLTFDELYRTLVSTRVQISSRKDKANFPKLAGIAQAFGDPTPSLLHLFWLLRSSLLEGVWIAQEESLEKAAKKLVEFGLVERNGTGDYLFSETGKQFLLRLRLERDTERAETFTYE